MSRSLGRRIWQTLSSVRNGIILLILVGLASAAGTFILQRPLTIPEQMVRAYSPRTLLWLDRVGLTNVYHTWWFATLLGLLCVSILLASIDRFPNSWRFYSRPYRRPDRFFRGGLQVQKTIPVTDPEQGIAAAERVLERAGLKPQRLVANNEVSLYAEKHRLSVMSVYVVHASLLLIVIGGLIDALVGYRGFITLTPGQQLSKIELQDGRAKNLPFTLRCDAAGQENYPDGTPKRWWSKLAVSDNGKEVLRKEIVVNDPLVYRGLRFYQASFGPTGSVQNVTLVARQRGTEKEITLDRQNPVQLDADTTVRMARFIPDFVVRDGEIYQRSNDLENPAIQLAVESKTSGASTVWLFLREGKSGQEGTSPYEFDYKDLKPGYYTGLEVSYEPGQWGVWAGSLLMAIGLGMVFYLAHTRIWAMVINDGAGNAALWIGGTVNKNREPFQERFQTLAQEIEKELAPAAEEVSEPRGASLVEV